MSNPLFEFCDVNCQDGKVCEREADIIAFVTGELISNDMQEPSLSQDVRLGAELTEECRRLYEIRETIDELAPAFLLAPFVEQPPVPKGTISS